MTSLHPWRGVRLATRDAQSDPDAPHHRVAVPTGWSASAAAGFAGLACDHDAPAAWNPLRLPDAAAIWIAPLDAAFKNSAAATVRTGACDTRDIGGPDEIGDFSDTLHCLLLLRQGCPDRALWRGETRPDHGFVLHLGGFADADTGFDWPCFNSAVSAATHALAIASPGGTPALRLAGLDDMFASLGIAYDSDEARSMAVGIVRRARSRMATHNACVSLISAASGPAEALLGVETSGYAPAFSHVGEDGRLTLAAQARLAQLRLSPERALAMALTGASPLQTTALAAHAAMHDALAPLLDASPARPALALHVTKSGPQARDLPDPHAVRRALPARSKGFTQKVSIGGSRLFLRTAEYADGRLGEISLVVHGRDGAGQRAMTEAFSSAVSIALQHGVPLDAFVDAYAHGHFGASGAVEGDPGIVEASSPLDYAFRALAEAYLGRHIPDPEAADDSDLSDAVPLLPFAMPGPGATARHVSTDIAGMRQRSLRLVRTS